MQRRQPRPVANLRARQDRALALYDPRRVQNVQPPEWWNDGAINILTKIAEWIAGKFMLFTILFLVKVLFMLLRGLLQTNSCNVANALLSKYTIEEVHDKFYDQDKEVQLEIAEQFHLREIESNNATGAIAKMALQCLEYKDYSDSSIRVLIKLRKTELLPHIVLQKLATAYNSRVVEQQPLSHLLEYYWSTKDLNMIQHIAEKLLLSAVVFEKKGETEMEVAFREKGANVKQTAPVEVVQALLSGCKDWLKEEYGLDFP